MDKNNINIDCILLLDKYSIEKNSFKYFVGYKNCLYGTMSLLIKLPKMNGYLKILKKQSIQNLYLKVSMKVFT